MKIFGPTHLPFLGKLIFWLFEQASKSMAKVKLIICKKYMPVDFSVSWTWSVV